MKKIEENLFNQDRKRLVMMLLRKDKKQNQCKETVVGETLENLYFQEQEEV